MLHNRTKTLRNWCFPGLLSDVGAAFEQTAFLIRKHSHKLKLNTILKQFKNAV